MKKRFRSRIAALCLLSFSSNVFASGGTIGNGIWSTQVHLPGGRSGIAEGVLSSKDLSGVISGLGNGKGITGTGISGTASGTGISGKDIDSGKYDVIFKPIKIPQKISGKFGSPQSELEKGNLKKAKLACLQQAASHGEPFPAFTDATAWEFASNISELDKLIKTAGESEIYKEIKSGNGPTALAAGACASEEKKACVALLDKAMNEEPQAYHMSEVNTNPEIWEEVAAFLHIPMDSKLGEPTADIGSALSEMAAKDDAPIDPKSKEAIFGATAQDSLLLATQLIVQAIDEALASGNPERAAKGKALLEKINPSAAQALNCVLAGLPNGGLNVDANPMLTGVVKPNVSRIGPISGIDYDKMKDLTIKGTKGAAIIAAITFGLLVAKGIRDHIKAWVDVHFSDKKDTREEDVEIERQLVAFDKCTQGKVYCTTRYPLGAKRHEELELAKKEDEKNAPKAVDTSGPATPAGSKDPFGSFPTSNTPSDIPCAGCGGAGGEMAPPDESMHGSSSIIDIIGNPDKQGTWKHVDPEAGERLCSQVVKEFKNYAIKQLGTKPVHEGPKNSGSGITAIGPKYSVTDINLTAEHLLKKEMEKFKNPGSHDNKNCNTMDGVNTGL